VPSAVFTHATTKRRNPISLAQEVHSLGKNRILSGLPPEDYERLAPHLEQVEMPLGQVLYEAGSRIDHVYFPLNSLISLVSQLSDGSGVEVGIIGFEGMSGLSIVLGVETSQHEAMVQINDGAMRMSAQTLRDEFKRGGAMQSLLLRYTQSLMVQMSQVAACNRLHTVEERLARWLLMSHDRCTCDDLPLTQEFLALMLGVRRAGVTTSALALQGEGYIQYKRGHITVTDRDGLEDYSCECYRVLNAEFGSEQKSRGPENKPI
jgi:CRP-like cAMP-binding protein